MTMLLLVRLEKGYDGRRPRTWVRITAEGRAALKQEVAALRELVARLSDLSLAVHDWDARSSAVAAAEALIADGLRRFLRWRQARAAFRQGREAA